MECDQAQDRRIGLRANGQRPPDRTESHFSNCTPITQRGFSVVTQSFCDYTDFTMVRPTLKPDQKKSCYFRVRLTKAERKKITRLAIASKEKDESTWARKRLLGESNGE